MQKHGFHLVDPSPWAITAASSVFGLTLGLAAWFNGYSNGFLGVISLISLIVVSILWWRDVLRESVYQGHHTKNVQKGITLGMILFIVSEIMLFAGFFWSFFHSALAPSVELGGIWVPRGIEVLDPFGIPFLNTLILLSSGLSVTWSHYAILLNLRQQTEISLGITIVLALIFTALQGYEYVSSTFTISDSVYGSCFYLLTGLHGLHVIVGTIFLAVCLARSMDGHFRKDHHLGFELAAIYFHFVDVVWLLVFVVVYYWGS
jgi:cytochrome c oxidase subunit 3